MASGLQNDSVLNAGDLRKICVDTSMVQTTNIWLNANPFNGVSSLLLFQLSSISLVSQLINICLKPLGQSSLVSQIVGGMLLGPSFLGYHRQIGDLFFPMRSTTVLSTFAGFGIMFFLFVTAVKMDPENMLRPGRKAAIIGATAMIVTMGSSIPLAFLLKKLLTMNAGLEKSIVLITTSQSIIGFPVIVTLLSELKILNTDMGRLAVSCSMFCDLIGISMVAIFFSSQQSKSGDPFGFLPPLLTTVAFVASIFLILRPRLIKTYYQTPDTKRIDEKSMVLIFILVILSGFVTDAIGQHYIFGPLLLGLAVPDGPPLGAAISSRLDTLATGFLYPAFCAVNGAKVNLLTVDFQSFYVVGIIVIFSSIIKLISVMLPALLLFDMPLREAVVLGLILNARGIAELTVYNLWMEGKLIDDEEFALVMMSVVAVTAFVTPMIKMLYDPSEQYASIKRSTVYHAERDSEFRLMVCIHSNENVATLMNLLEVSYASRENPVVVTTMALVELIGRFAPALISNQRAKNILPTINSSLGNRLMKPICQYEERNAGYAHVESYTSISHFETMHDDICRIAFEKHAHIIIMAFHKQWAIDGMIESKSRPIENLNTTVMEKAPCSVGILVDRGSLSGFGNSVLNSASKSKFQVAVLFIGGPDDVDALAYGCRMVKHESVVLTVVRFLLFGGENSKDRKNDSHLINDYRQENIGNKRFLYVEEVLRDGEGLSSFISGMTDYFQLIIVGRYHPYSPLLEGLGEWCECPELGVVGDILASNDIKTKTSLLVIQQQRLGGKMLNLPYVVRTARTSQVVSVPFPEELPLSMDRQTQNQTHSHTHNTRNNSFSISVHDLDLDLDTY